MSSQSWKRGERKSVNDFRPPVVPDEIEHDDNIRGSDLPVRFFTALWGFIMLTSLYAVGFYFGLTAIGLDSLEYSDAVIISACFVFIRYLDQVILERPRNKR